METSNQQKLKKKVRTQIWEHSATVKRNVRELQL